MHNKNYSAQWFFLPWVFFIFFFFFFFFFYVDIAVSFINKYNNKKKYWEEIEIAFV